MGEPQDTMTWEFKDRGITGKQLYHHLLAVQAGEWVGIDVFVGGTESASRSNVVGLVFFPNTAAESRVEFVSDGSVVTYDDVVRTTLTPRMHLSEWLNPSTVERFLMKLFLAVS